MAAANDRRAAADARAEAVARYRERLKKFPNAPRTDEALFFLADTLQDSGRDQEAVASARELTRRFPRSQWAPASHVFIGEHLFDQAKLDAALKEYRAAAEVKDDEVYPYALYKAAWCRFNQNAFADAMKLLRRVVQVSEKSGDVNTVQLAREARRDYVLAYARSGKPEAARDEFARVFGAKPGLRMLEQFGKLLFDTGRDPEAQLVHRQLLALHGDLPAAALDQTRLLMLAQRGGKRRDLLTEAQRLVDTFRRVRQDDKDENLEEANRRGEETLRNLAVQIHNEARKTHLDETWAAARALYSDYLALFPQAPDAYDLRYFYGELLYARGFKAEAAEQYEAVVKQDLASKTPGRWLQKSAWSGVLSRSEAMLHGAAEEKDTGERRTQRALTREEQNLAAACGLYLQALPDGPHAVEVAFRLGRLEYLSSQYDAASKHLSWIALSHPEHELSEYAANLVLDIENLRGNWQGVHAWALKFLGDRKLTAHGTLAQDLRRIEEQSAYALAEAVAPDGRKASALLAFVQAHPHGQLADKALFGAAAALSRAGQLDAALAARARVWKERPQSPLVPRALLASASDLAAVGELGEAAALLEKYAAGFQKEQATRKWRAAHPARKTAKKAEPEPAAFDEAKAQVALHDAAVLREARGELRQALSDRALSLQLWKAPADRDEQLYAQAKLRARLGEIRARRGRWPPSPAARSRSPTCSSPPGARPRGSSPRCTRAATRSGRGRRRSACTGRCRRRRARASRPTRWPPRRRRTSRSASRDSRASASQEIRQPLMTTLNRKIALLQAVRKRAEETVAMRQAEPAVCALAQLGEAQMMLGQAIATSPYPPGLNADQRKLYRDALSEKAQPLSVEARETLKSADARARELGVNGPCAQRVGSLLEKLAAKAADRPQMTLARSPVLDTPQMLDGRAVQGERAKRLLDEALSAAKGLEPARAVEKFQAAAQAEPSPATHFDLAVALDRAGRALEAEQEYRVAGAARGALGYEAAARAASLAAARGDAQAARSSLSLAEAALPGIVAGRALRAELELALGNPAAAQAAARSALAQAPTDVRALCAMARAVLAQGQEGAAGIFAARAERADATDPEPLLVKAEIARAANEPGAELAAVRAAVEVAPDAPQAQLALGRALYERGDLEAALNALEDAVNADPHPIRRRWRTGRRSPRRASRRTPRRRCSAPWPWRRGRPNRTSPWRGSSWMATAMPNRRCKRQNFSSP